MIHPDKLQPSDIGRKIIYHRAFCKPEEGELSSWNASVIFVRFKGPTGEACEPLDITFSTAPWRNARDAALAAKETK